MAVANRTEASHSASLEEVIGRNAFMPVITLVGPLPFVAVILLGAAIMSGLKLVMMALKWAGLVDWDSPATRMQTALSYVFIVVLTTVMWVAVGVFQGDAAGNVLFGFGLGLGLALICTAFDLVWWRIKLLVS